MIKVTQRAKEELGKLLNSNASRPSDTLRLVPDGKGELGLSLGEEMPGDQVVRCDEAAVLLVESEISAALDGMTLDVEDTEQGLSLSFSR